jgi:hypothetical protein
VKILGFNPMRYPLLARSASHDLTGRVGKHSNLDNVFSLIWEKEWRFKPIKLSRLSVLKNLNKNMREIETTK